MTTAAIASVSLFQPQTSPKTILPIHTTFRLPIRFQLASPRRRDLQRVLATTLLPKCLGSDGEGAYENDGTVYPRPEEITWTKELANSVSLIGIVGPAVQIRELKSGRSFAWTSILVRRPATGGTWVTINFWNDLAHVAFQHVVKGQKIHVSGRLEFETVEKRVLYKVVVDQLNLIESHYPQLPSHINSKSTPESKSGTSYASNQSVSVEQLWQAYFANPSEWRDTRQNKKSSRHPDFKHKDTGKALWVEASSTPPWVKSQLEILDAGRRATKENE